MIKEVNVEDVRPYVDGTDFGRDDELLNICDMTKFDFQDKALVLGFMFFVYCYEGKAELEMADMSYTIQAGDLLMGLPGQTVKNCHKSDDFKGRIVIVSENYCRESMVGLQRFWPFLLYVYKNPILHLNTSERERLKESLTMVFQRRKEEKYLYLQEVTLALIRVFFLDLCDILSQHSKEPTAEASRMYVVFDNFVELVHAHCETERRVSWYGEQLCLSPKYVSEVVKQVSGRTAGQWIADVVLLRIKNLLKNTPLSIKEITRKLNFANQSALGKFFKNGTGLSPLEYRRS